ncbi:MAG TPA: hypothetical protein VGB98_25440 [Pyrinomonadaceae bacterium]
MQQRPEKFRTGDGDPEATLVAPRFDDEEARRAHPVVPLAQPGAHAPHAGAYARRGARRSWPTALLAVALLAVAAVGGAVASMVLRPTPSAPPAAQAPAALAPAQAAEVPAQEIPTRVEPAPALAAPREVADTNPREAREVTDGKPEARAPRDSQPRRDEGAAVRVRNEAAHGERESYEDEDGDRRGKRERRRERREDEGEKETRKVLKRGRDKAPRLVDVLVSPGN